MGHIWQRDWLKALISIMWTIQCKLTCISVISPKLLSLGQTRKHCCGNIVIRHVSSGVSVFAHPWKHRCINTICFPSSRNVFFIKFRNISCFPSVRFLLRKHCFLVFSAHLGKHGETLAGNNVSETMFPSFPRALMI